MTGDGSRNVEDLLSITHQLKNEAMKKQRYAENEFVSQSLLYSHDYSYNSVGKWTDLKCYKGKERVFYPPTYGTFVNITFIGDKLTKVYKIDEFSYPNRFELKFDLPQLQSAKLKSIPKNEERAEVYWFIDAYDGTLVGAYSYRESHDFKATFLQLYSDISTIDKASDLEKYFNVPAQLENICQPY